MKDENNLPPIPKQASLAEWQSYVKELVRARKWDRASDLEVFLLFTEEVGEMAKAFRQHRKLFTETKELDLKASKQELALEMADVFSYLLDLAQRFDISLEEAVIEKESINRLRHWEV